MNADSAAGKGRPLYPRPGAMRKTECLKGLGGCANCTRLCECPGWAPWSISTSGPATKWYLPGGCVTVSGLKEVASMVEQIEHILEQIYQKSQSHGGSTIAILQDIQDELGYISEEAVEWMSKRTGIATAKYYGVATFYAQFHLHPRGKNIITVCSGTVCHVKGAQKIIGKLKADLQLKGEAQTTRDMQFTLENVNCVGACSIAPVVIVNEKVFGKQNPDSMVKNIKAYKK